MVLERARIIEIENELVDGIKRSDVHLLETILHDDLLFVAPNGQVITKQMDLDSHRRGDMVVDYLSPSVEEIRILGNTATVVVQYDTKGTMLGNPIQGRFRYIRIWKEFEGDLKVIGGACFSLN